MNTNKWNYKTLAIAPKVHQLLAMQAAKEGRPNRAVAEEAILEYLARREAREYVKEAEHDLAT